MIQNFIRIVIDSEAKVYVRISVDEVDLGSHATFSKAAVLQRTRACGPMSMASHTTMPLNIYQGSKASSYDLTEIDGFSLNYIDSSLHPHFFSTANSKHHRRQQFQ